MIIENTLQLLPLFSGETDELIIEGDLEISPKEVNEGVVLSGPVHVSGILKNMSGYITLRLAITADYDTVCDRCLKPLHRTEKFSLDKSVAVAGTLEEEDSYEVENEYILIENNQLDLGETVLEVLILELPWRHLCREDCRGLCAKCGHDLNEGDCGCPKKDIDPRLAVLSSLLNKSNE